MRRLVAVVVVTLALAPQAAGGGLPLTTRLAHALAVRGNASSASGAVAVDLVSGHVLFARNPDLPLVPASNEKLAVTFAALRQLGPSYRFRTQVVATGAEEGAVWHGNVFLKGFGDPTLDGLHLDRLAAQIRRLGIRRIDGRLLADESWFDGRRTAPGWKSSFFLFECPPLSALVANRAVYDRHIALSPAVAAAGLFRRLLRRHGVTTGPVATGRAPGSASVLAQSQSAPLTAVVREMDRDSDNFAAEMLLKDLGAEARGAGTTAAGAAVVGRALADAGVPLAGVRIVDGSGLSLLDRVTARMLAALLLTAWNDPALQEPVWRALPVAGENGTLEDRMQRPPARGRVHAKTGTTDRASALSGYVGERYAFAVVQNGWPVSWSAARKAQDRFATALAASARAQ